MNIMVIAAVIVGCIGAASVGGVLIIENREGQVSDQNLEATGRSVNEVSPVAEASDTPVPTAVLLPGRPMSYVPTEADMPSGYILDPGLSGPNPLDGYSAGYVNTANFFDTAGRPMYVVYTVALLGSEQEAESYFASINSVAAFGEIMPSLLNLEAVDAEVPNVDDVAAFWGVAQGTDPLVSANVVAFFVRYDNLFAIVMTGCNAITPKDIQVRASTYYVSLVTNELPVGGVPVAPSSSSE